MPMGSLRGPMPPAAIITTPANATPMPIMSDLGNPSFSSDPRGERDEQRGDVHEHRRRAGVEVTLGDVQHERVAREPEHPVRRDECSAATSRQRRPAARPHRCERDGAHELAPECERAR